MFLEMHMKRWMPIHVDEKRLKVDDLHHCQNVQRLLNFLIQYQTI